MGSLIDDAIEEVPGDDVELVDRAQGCLELLPLQSATQDAFRDTFEKKESLFVGEKMKLIRVSK